MGTTLGMPLICSSSLPIPSTVQRRCLGEAGTFTIRLQAKLTWTGPTTGLAEGRIVIDSDAGGYEKLHGISETYAEINLESG